MTPDPTIDQRIAAWLTSEAPSQMPDRVLVSTFAITRATRQVGWLSGWRSIRMRSMPVAIAAGAVAILVLILGGVAIIGSPTKATPSPTSSASPTASPASSALASNAANPSASPAFVQLGPGYNTNGWITFSVQDAAQHRSLYVVGAATNNETQIVAAEPCCGVFSPDGKRIAVGEVDPATHRYRTAIFQATFPIAGGPSTKLPTVCGGCGSLVNLDYVPRAWSPDGHWVAIQGTSDAEPTKRNGIYLAVADGTTVGGGITWITTYTGAGRSDTPLAFSPDSTRLLFKRSTSDGDSGDLYVVSVPRDPGPGTPAARKLNPPGTTIQSSDAFGSGASWSPDGTKVAFAAGGASPHGNDIYVVDIATGKATDIAAGSGTTTSARWSPDGQWIAYDIPSVDGATHDEWIVHPDGSGAKDLTTTYDGGVCCGEWSPDSQVLVVQGGSYDNTGLPDQLIELGLDGTSGVLVQLSTPTQFEDYSWAPSPS